MELEPLLARSHRLTAAFSALFAGGLGVHRIYLRQPTAFALSVLFCWTFIPALIALFNAVDYFMKSDEEFGKRYPRR